MKYERMFDLCYGCGRLGYTSQSCVNELIMSEFKPEFPLYGPWLSGVRPRVNTKWFTVGDRSSQIQRQGDSGRRTWRDVMIEARENEAPESSKGESAKHRNPSKQPSVSSFESSARGYQRISPQPVDYLGRHTVRERSQTPADPGLKECSHVVAEDLNSDVARRQPNKHPSGCSSAGSRVLEPGRLSFDLNAPPYESDDIPPEQVTDFLTLSLSMQSEEQYHADRYAGTVPQRLLVTQEICISTRRQ